MDSIRAVNVIKEYGKVRALDGVSVEVQAGELFFLLGASGCGKTTLLRSIAGLETPTSGQIFFGAQDVTKLPPHKREAAMVFQSYALWPHLSVEKNVAFGLEERRISKDEIRRRVGEALELVHLGGMGERGIDQMSGGQQQRVALARALVVRPKCLLLDEPLSNLDAKLRIEMRREIRRIVKEGGLTGIYVTHDQEEALSMADRMAVLNRGKIEQLGTAEEVYRHPMTSFVSHFIGETNLIEGTLKERHGDTAVVETAGGTLEGRLTRPGWQPTAGTKVMLSIRPESWNLVKPPAMPLGNSVKGRVSDLTYLGQRIQYTLETPLGLQQVVELNPLHVLEPGETPHTLQVRAEDVIVLES
jgi:iron(III) transport system ATP-binding protein